MAQIIDGKQAAAQLREELARKIAKEEEKPVLAVVLAGENEASKVYVRNKKKNTKIYIYKIHIKCNNNTRAAEKTNF